MLYAAGITACTALYFFMLFVPFFPSIPIVIEGHPVLHLIPWPAISKLVLAITLLLPPGVAALYVHWRRKYPNASPRAGIFLPAAFLPLAYIGPLLPGRIPLDVSSNLLFIVPLVILTLIIYRRMRLCEQTPQKQSTRRTALILFIGLTLFYTAGGTYLSSRIGEHDVDEGHYLIQAQSLYDDHDLNIRNNFGFDIDQAINDLMAKEQFTPEEEAAVRERVTTRFRAYLHISAFSPDNEWRSWHPYGISLLLAPFSAMGIAGRQLVLALISACGCTLLFLICIRLGRSACWSVVIILLLAGSCYWFVYSCRSLPEVLGATLFLSAVYATFLTPNYPFRSFIMLIASCAGMVIAHPRFAPCAGLAGIWYYLYALFIHPLRKSTRLAYIGLLLAGILFAAGYLLINLRLYQNLTSYETVGLFGVYPEGAWLILFSERGLFYSLPLAAAMLTALIYALFRDREHRLFHVLAAISLLILVVVVGTSDCWDGGPTMSGRYLLIAVPLLIPATVILAERTHAFGKCWILLLGLFSCMVNALALCTLPRIGEGFLHRPQAALKQAIPLLRNLFEPYFISDIMAGKPYHGLDAFTTNPFPVLLLLVTLIFILQRKPRPKRNTFVLVLFILIAMALHFTHGRPAFTWPPDAVEYVLSNTPLARARVTPYNLQTPPRLTPHSNRFTEFKPVSLTTDDLGQAQVDQCFSQPRLDQNDWEGHDYRWFTLVPPFNSGISGLRKITISGRHEGPLELYAVVKEGAQPLCYECIPLRTEKASFKWSTVLDCGRYRGDTYILFRLEGRGTVHFEEIAWTPVPGFERASE